MDNKIISVLHVVGHQMILMDQSNGLDVSYYCDFIPDRIGRYGEVANYFCVCVNPELQWTRRHFLVRAYLIFDRYFPLLIVLHVN